MIELCTVLVITQLKYIYGTEMIYTYFAINITGMRACIEREMHVRDES